MWGLIFHLTYKRIVNLINKILKKALAGLTVFFLFILFHPVPLKADKLILNEGKTLHGKITKETKTEIMFELGGNMYIRVEKSKIKKIVRSKRPKKPRNIVTLESIQKSTTTKKAIQGTKTSEEKTIPLIQIKAGKTLNRRQVRNAEIFETLIHKSYKVKGRKISAVKKGIFERRKGVGFAIKGGREASTVVMKAKWTGEPSKVAGEYNWKSLVIRSTFVVTAPLWKSPKSPPPKAVEGWNQFIQDLIKHDEGHLDLYRRSLDGFAKSLNNLRAPEAEQLQAESTRLFQTFQSRAGKQQNGHDRRFRRKNQRK